MYNLEGVIGENSVPFYKSSNSKYLSINIYADTDDPFTWIVSDRLGSFNAVIMNRFLRLCRQLVDDILNFAGNTRMYHVLMMFLIPGSSCIMDSGYKIKV